MKFNDVRAMTKDQVKDEVLKLKKEQFNLRFQRATGQVENTARIRQIRRDIARLKTVAVAAGRREVGETRMPKRILQGVVVSDKNDKTIVVQVERRLRHPVLKKTVRLSKKYHAHDEKNEAKTGDIVRIEETRPLSKQKRWALVEKVAAGQA